MSGFWRPSHNIAGGVLGIHHVHPLPTGILKNARQHQRFHVLAQLQPHSERLVRGALRAFSPMKSQVHIEFTIKAGTSVLISMALASGLGERARPMLTRLT